MTNRSIELRRACYEKWRRERRQAPGKGKRPQPILLVIVALVAMCLSALVLIPMSSSNSLTHQRARVTVSPPTRSEQTPADPTPASGLFEPGDWTTYMADNAHSGFNPDETIITPATAPKLQLQWTHQSGGAVVSQPVVADGLIYWGSWDGYEYATTLDNKTVWATFLGKTVADPTCIPPRLGVSSTPTVAWITIHGTPTLVVFLGGGDGNFYALNARTGAIIWKTFLGSPPGYYLWSSPTLYHGTIYMGASSLGDCPLVQGKLVQIDPATGKILHLFKGVVDGCIGGGVWTSPTIDGAAGTIYIATGSKHPCYVAEPYALALIELRASDLSLIQYYQVPKSQRIADGDFGATPTLFTTSTGIPMVGVVNKNSIYYAFRRGNLSNPLWETKIAMRHGTISSSAWDGHRLYVGARATVINGVRCAESVVALDPDSGSIIWRHCQPTDGLIGAIIAVPGLVIFGQAGDMVILDATSGQPLFTYVGKRKKGVISLFRGWASVSHGVIYIGGTDGNLYAFALSTPVGTH